MFIFANQAGLDMLETTLVALQDITLDKIFDESGRKALFADFAKLMQQVISTSEQAQHTHIIYIVITIFVLYLKLQPRLYPRMLLIFRLLVYSCIRGLLIFLLGSACPPWGGTSHMSKPLHGKCLLEKITLSTA